MDDDDITWKGGGNGQDKGNEILTFDSFKKRIHITSLDSSFISMGLVVLSWSWMMMIMSPSC